MSEFNSILTDKELRGLLQQYLLEQEEDNALTEKMIEMESKIAFGTVPMVALAMPNEAEMIGKLTKSFVGKTSLYAWTIGLGASAILGMGIYTYSGSSGQPEKSTVPAVQPKEIPVKENEIPDVTPANIPVNPNSSTAYFPLLTDTSHEETGPTTVVGRFCQEDNQTPDPAPVIVAPDPNLTAVTPLTIVTPDPPIDRKKKKGEPVVNAAIDTVYSGIKKLEVNAGMCKLNVIRGKSDKVIVKGAIMVEAKGIVKSPDFNFKQEQKGDVLKILVEQSKNCNVIVGSLNINGYLNVEVPAGTDVDLSNSSGDINLVELDGRLCKVKSSYGNINAVRINTAFDFSAQSGDISIVDCNGGANLQSAYGDVKITRQKGNTSVKVTSGDMSVKELTADRFDVDSHYGNINMMDVIAPLMLKAGSGDILLTNIKGDVNIQSSYGNQLLRSVFGNFVSTSSSGDVKVENLTGDINIQSTYGNVTANSCKGNILVKSQSGDIKGKNIQLHDALDLSATYGNIKMQIENPLDELSFDLVAVSGDLNVKKGGTDINGKEGKLRLDKGKIRVKGNTTSGDQVYE